MIEFKLYGVAVVLLSNILSASAAKVLIELKPQSCPGKNPVHTESDDRLIIDYATVVETDSAMKMLSVAVIPIGKSFLADGIKTNYEYEHSDALVQGGKALNYDGKSNYSIILNVRAKTMKYDDGIFYHYRESVMHWSESKSDVNTRDDTIHFKSPFLIGDIKVKMDDKTLITRSGSKQLCENSYAWIPQHGIYRLNNNNNEWVYMFYYPHYFPQYLS